MLVTSNFSFSLNVFYPIWHFKMSSAICFNLDRSKNLSSGNANTRESFVALSLLVLLTLLFVCFPTPFPTVFHLVPQHAFLNFLLSENLPPKYLSKPRLTQAAFRNNRNSSFRIDQIVGSLKRLAMLESNQRLPGLKFFLH